MHSLKMFVIYFFDFFISLQRSREPAWIAIPRRSDPFRRIANRIATCSRFKHMDRWHGYGANNYRDPAALDRDPAAADRAADRSLVAGS
jgi:hypothetical protein